MSVLPLRDPVSPRVLQAGPPSFAFEPVATRALVKLLRAEPFPRLVTVTAPPGYGKTVLLSSLYRELSVQGRNCLWLTLDDRDADLSALLGRLRGVLGHAGGAGRPDAAEQVLHVAFRDPGTAVDRVVKSLTELAATVLFIDNLNFCGDPALERFLERLVFSAENLHLVLSSTREIPIDAARAKLEVGAVEYRAQHISFDRDSTAALLGRAGLAGLSHRELDRIVGQTEGWPAAVRLVQVLLAELDASAVATGSVDVVSVLQRFGGDQGDMARVLTNRVLRGFDPEIVQFMVELSLVRDFNAELARHMTGRAESHAWLEMLVSRNVLTFPLDSSRRWYRFHTLLREFLLAEAGDRMTPEARHDRLVRAAQWYRDRGEHATALDIALDAGAADLAQDLLDRLAHVVVGDHGEMASLIQWVDRLLRSGVHPSPDAHAWYVWALCDSLQYERARQALDDLDRRVAGDPRCASDELRERMLLLRMMVGVFTDRLDEVLPQAMAWLARNVAADALTAAAITTFAAIGELHLGDLNAAAHMMERARATIDRSDSAYGLAWVCIVGACVEIGQARPAAADELLRAGRERVVRVIGSDASVVVTLDFVHARALLDLGETAEARALALRGLARAAGHGILTSLEQGLSACVDLWEGPDDPTLPESLLSRVACGYPARAAALLAAAKVRRLLALKRPTDANAEAQRLALAGSTAAREHGDLALASLELRLAQNACNTVLPRTEELLKRAQRQGRERERVELHLVACEAYRRLGNELRARRHLALAISIAAPGGLIHPFKANSLMLASLDESTFGFVRKVERDFLQRLRAWLASDAPAAAPGSVAAAALSIRELQVLALLDEGLGNEQVADRLELSVPTVKWHLHNAYVKMGVRSRSAALARARALKLLAR